MNSDLPLELNAVTDRAQIILWQSLGLPLQYRVDKCKWNAGDEGWLDWEEESDDAGFVDWETMAPTDLNKHVWFRIKRDE